MKIRYSLMAAVAVTAGFTVASTLTTRFAEGEENPYKVIYGTDNRTDLYDVNDPSLLKWADSTVAMIDQKHLSANGDHFQLTTRGYGESNNLCQNERFYEQKVGAGCSGVLVGKNLVLTAGHCIFDERQCSQLRIVFGFSLTEPGQDSKTFNFPASDVYRCVKLRDRKQILNGPDWALLELDRDVVGHEPLAVDRTSDPRMRDVLAASSLNMGQVGELVKGSPLVLISHPMGIPTKIDAGGVVRSVTPGAATFVVTTDSFDASSGAPVLNSVNGKIMGLLIDGEEDFNIDQLDEKRCRYSKRCDESECKGESVVRISTMVQSIPLLPAEQAEIDALKKKKEAEAAKKAAPAASSVVSSPISKERWRDTILVKASSAEGGAKVLKTIATASVLEAKPLPAIAFEEGSFAPSFGY